MGLSQVTMTADMLFWLGWGQTWCKAQEVDGLISQIATDEHSPSQAPCGISNMIEYD